VFGPARRTLTSAIRGVSTGGGGGGGSERRHGRRSSGRVVDPVRQTRKALSKYIQARGGPKRTALRLDLATGVGARLFVALDRIAREGFDAALAGIGVTVNEQGAGALVDALTTLVLENAAEGLDGILDESMARAACIETFIALYESGLSITELSAEQVPSIVRSFAINAAAILVSKEIGTALVDRPRTEEQVRDLQSTLRSVIDASMQMELPTAGSEYTIRDVRSAISKAYENAFRILRASR
jgi:adenosyl cobinamide kinase/adenosyl cobinamide phosphate guanylyltransferase